MIRRLKALHIANAALEAAEPLVTAVALHPCPGCRQLVELNSPQALGVPGAFLTTVWHAWCLVKARAAGHPEARAQGGLHRARELDGAW